MTPSELITKGKAAVEAELARIEGDLAVAKSVAVMQSTAIAQELKKHVDIHADEVSTGLRLIEAAGRAGGAEAVPHAAENVVGVLLNARVSTATRVKQFFTPFTWKHGMLVGMALLVSHYLLGKII